MHVQNLDNDFAEMQIDGCTCDHYQTRHQKLHAFKLYFCINFGAFQQIEFTKAEYFYAEV